ncbi:MAG: helix-turn-helix domain-containing protein [Cyclobacteriaceae bacterium]|nr:helix-turn-helix domain-containing protein [Cyclobacteriaceae bacterium]
MVHKIDLFSIFIFLGIVQAIFLCLFFFSKENRKIQANFFQGIMIAALAACCFEILLCYTGFIVNALWLVDYSESLAFLIGPSFYLMIVCLIDGKAGSKWYLHFIPALIWLMLQVPFLIQGNAVKYNAWIGAYHPTGLSFMEVEENFFNPPYHSQFILAHLTIYVLLGFWTTLQAFKKRNQSFWKTEQESFKKLRSSLLQVLIVTVVIFMVKLINQDDLGDHLFAAYMTVPIYLISFQVVRQSGFFKQPNLSEPQKYKTSSLSVEDQKAILEKLSALMKSEKPFLKPEFSLPDLAAQLKTSTHQLSQVINEGLGKSFFEMTAKYRMEEAKQLLKDQPNIKVEEIAEQVGYNSKSSFNTAFKKLTGKTPSEWRS